MEREYPCNCPYCHSSGDEWIHFLAPSQASKLAFVKCPSCGFAMIKMDGDVDALISMWNKLTKQDQEKNNG